jgi:hypothetical protein
MDKERLPQKILNWTSTGRRKRGRPETRWKEGKLRDMKECGLRDEDREDRLTGDWVSRDVATCHRTITYILSHVRFPW